MKFGKYLEANLRQQWRTQYLDYNALKELIKQTTNGEGGEEPVLPPHSPRTTSLSVHRTHNGDSMHERFFRLLNEEVEKVGKFTQMRVTELRSELRHLDSKIDSRSDDERSATQEEQINSEAQRIGLEFICLEKYVNLNYMGFHKILKKHDKQIPHTPCRSFYLSHLHHQPWVQGNYSDVLVNLSNIYSKLRKDRNGQRNEDSAQGFIRSTTKYWVRSEDISIVKHHILQHLPVFQFNVEDFSGDAQLINSVYLDNSSLELYHSRLDKRPNAIAVRLRWYGPKQPPALVFVERKTHREGWKGEESVKERFVLPEDRVVSFLEAMDYKREEACQDLALLGKTEEEIRQFGDLFHELQQQVDSKQLKPVIRTQYMRTAFQIPFDATVRVSLDTNLVMIKENPDGGPSTTLMGRWCRDPSLPITRTEITRFPHAVLEVKLSMQEGQPKPAWLLELLDSGYLTEVYKFSKFIHGTATLFPDMVQSVPYWVDDASVRTSMLMSAPSPRDEIEIHPKSKSPFHLNLNGEEPPETVAQCEPPDASSVPRSYLGYEVDDLRHPLLGDEPALDLMGDRVEKGFGRKRKEPNKPTLFAKLFGAAKPKAVPRTTPMRVEPKTFFANERTFLSWMNMAITVGSIAMALLGFSGTAARGNKHIEIELVDLIAMILLPVAIVTCMYALFIFIWRGRVIAKKQVYYFDDKIGPLGLSVVVVASLVSIFCIGTYDFISDIADGASEG